LQFVRVCSEWQLGGGRFKGAGRGVDTLNTWSEGSGRSYNLKHREQKRYIGWEYQRWGVNLGYSSDATTDTAHKMARWFFTGQAESSRMVRFGELVAMGYGTSPSFYKYAVTNIGINLVNTGTPSYEWRLIGAPGTAGQIVRTGEPLAIWNEVEEGFLIYFDRNLGVDLGWPDSQREYQLPGPMWGEAVKEAAKTYIEAYAKASASG
jgi:hypothetical protein